MQSVPLKIKACYCPIVVVVVMQCVAGRLKRFQFVAAMRLKGRQLVLL